MHKQRAFFLDFCSCRLNRKNIAEGRHREVFGPSSGIVDSNLNFLKKFKLKLLNSIIRKPILILTLNPKFQRQTFSLICLSSEFTTCLHRYSTRVIFVTYACMIHFFPFAITYTSFRSKVLGPIWTV